MMPKRVVGILIVGVLAALSGAAGAAQQDHTTKTASQPAPQPVSMPAQTNAGAATKFPAISRDVCAKHPNLKQCS